MELFGVESQCKLADKPRSFAGRVQQALEQMPQSIAQYQTIALAVDRSQKYAFVSDENVHSFARSRASPDNVMQSFRSEGFLQPQQFVVQKPMQNGFTSRDQRATQYDLVQPVGCGYNLTRDWQRGPGMRR
jgi:hypothetical protein